MTKEIRLDYVPQQRQALFHATEAKQILYGGSAGGGKSHSLRWDIIRFCLHVPGLDAFLFRKTRPELEANHIRRIRTELPPELGEYTDRKNRYEFFNGSGINFCYCEKESDVERHQGSEMHYLGIDEAGQLTDYQLNYLRARVRLGSFKVPEKYKDFLPRIAFTSNPGGPGHQFLRQTFIDPAPRETIFLDRTLEIPGQPGTGWKTIFIPARMADNKYLDPSYAGQFTGLPPELAKALRDGDWDAVVGQALHTLNRERHQLRQFSPPKHWTKFQVIDWGTASPFSVGWFCVSEGAELPGRDGWPPRWLPSGSVILYDEWYGWNGKANQGMRLSAQSVAKEIVRREDERKEVMDYRVGDTEMWAQKGGPSIAEWFLQTDPRLIMRKSEKDRKRNYQEIMARLAGNSRYTENGEQFEDPMLFATANCVHFWRTLPPLVLDDVDPEKGPDTHQEDHCLSGDTLVVTLAGEKRIDEFSGGESVLTTDGWMPSVNLGRTQQAEVWTLKTTDGRTIRATPNHKFLCTDGRYRRLDELTYSDYLVSLEQPRRERWRNTSTAKLTGSAENIINGAVAVFIAWYGNLTTEKFPKGFISTIKTTIEKITIFPILSLCPRPSICGSIKIRQSAALTKRCTLKESGRWLRLGTARKKEDGGTRFLREGQERQSTDSGASFADLRGWPTSQTQGFARQNAGRRISAVGILDITRSSKKEDVYNLHVPEANNFAVAGGIVVHNCYDQVVYGLRSRPFVTTEEDRRRVFEGEDEDRALKKSVDPYATH